MSWAICKNDIRDGGSTALYTVYTVYTVNSVLTVNTVQTVLHCSNSSMHAYTLYRPCPIDGEMAGFDALIIRLFDYSKPASFFF